MARKNKKGSSFLALGLEKSEEKELKRILKSDGKSGKRLIIKLVRTYIKEHKNE